MKFVTLTYFPKGADSTTRKRFANALVKALEELDVDHGDEFIVAAVVEQQTLTTEGGSNVDANA